MSERASADALGLARRLIGLLAGAALLAVSVTGVLLAQRYRPTAPGPAYLLHSTARAARRLVGAHEAAMSIAMPATSIWAALSLAATRTRRRSAGAAIVLSAAFALATSLTWRLVRFDQLALWAVTVGDDLRGLWYAAFSDDVRWVLVGSAEVSQATYATWLLVHLLSPALALVAMVIGWRTTRRGDEVGTPGPAAAPVPPLL